MTTKPIAEEVAELLNEPYPCDGGAMGRWVMDHMDGNEYPSIGYTRRYVMDRYKRFNDLLGRAAREFLLTGSPLPDPFKPVDAPATGKLARIVELLSHNQQLSVYPWNTTPADVIRSQ